LDLVLKPKAQVYNIHDSEDENTDEYEYACALSLTRHIKIM